MYTVNASVESGTMVDGVFRPVASIERNAVSEPTRNAALTAASAWAMQAAGRTAFVYGAARVTLSSEGQPDRVSVVTVTDEATPAAPEQGPGLSPADLADLLGTGPADMVRQEVLLALDQQRSSWKGRPAVTPTLLDQLRAAVDGALVGLYKRGVIRVQIHATCTADADGNVTIGFKRAP